MKNLSSFVILCLVSLINGISCGSFELYEDNIEGQTINRENKDSLRIIIFKETVNMLSMLQNLVSTKMLIKIGARPKEYDSILIDDFIKEDEIELTNITYKWIVNGSPQEESGDFIERYFSPPQLYNITVIVTATQTNGTRLIPKTGSASLKLLSRDPITNLTVEGPTEVKVFERLELNCKIQGGTPPFDYHYISWLHKPNYEYESGGDLINGSSFSIINYFSEKGTRELYLSIINGVSTIRKTMSISVY